MDVSNERARAAGLTLTGPEVTMRDMQAWIPGEELDSRTFARARGRVDQNLSPGWNSPPPSRESMKGQWLVDFMDRFTGSGNPAATFVSERCHGLLVQVRFCDRVADFKLRLNSQRTLIDLPNRIVSIHYFCDGDLRSLISHCEAVP